MATPTRHAPVLDADRRTAFLDLLFRECAREGAALIFVSHDASLAAQFDRVIQFGEINRTTAPARETA